MLGSVASVLVPGVSITKVSKVSKVSQVTGELQDASKLIDKVQDVNKVFRKPESLADLLPFTSVVTPEGVWMIVRKDIPGQVHSRIHKENADGFSSVTVEGQFPAKSVNQKGEVDGEGAFLRD